MEAQQGKGPTRTTLLEAVQALYHHPDPSIRNAANQWLDEIHHTIEAWQVVKAKLVFKIGFDTPLNVAVKVCHPAIALSIYQDFQIMSVVAHILQGLPALRWLNLRQSIDQFSHTMTSHVSKGVIVETSKRGAALHYTKLLFVGCPFNVLITDGRRLCNRFLNGEPFDTSDMFSYCPPWAFSWTYRKQNLLREIVSYGTDILCFLEVQSDPFDEYGHLDEDDQAGELLCFLMDLQAAALKSFGGGAEFDPKLYVDLPLKFSREVTEGVYRALPKSPVTGALEPGLCVTLLQSKRQEDGEEEETSEHIYEIKNDVGRACFLCGLIIEDIKDMIFTWRLLAGN